ncbi:SusC/RagA family TonB-linked outer membrane protein [Phocaeicola vulgatus CL09T03C04]|uniref:SusC/RagA family TonB-linked outer membrane protein n=1 Tax=Phocaeicola vulgatus CL09T03C04 TaxID=997891 RepID=I8ZWQ0_PHOVU|nr:TonB-dependent receptor [Phocaeicola vulgatus]EIY79945.1 SusC/RagA family TonB-linked outer membrane protein [Phocaeicola vulgatus CL09T03C04]MDB0796018.1 TonB-dependent receptor [Phocaeicola vulgatus]MDU7567284.1 TonB-dependent receptor [Bacteroides sp.]
MKRNLMFKVLLMLVIGCFLSIDAFAQQITVKGLVKDTAGEPIIGANVVIKGTTNGTITDFDGNFQLNANKGDIIVISFIGYQPQEVQAAASMNIILKDDTELLDEVVVIGYGSVKKDDLSGSVVAIKAEEMNKGAVTSPQELIMGKVPGLSVSQGDGAPGAGSTIRIRGGASLNASNDPLIVIDGIPVSNDAAPGTPNALATINPNDIETFTVLKDASATAIYGSRASNGVIIIQTKKGTQDKIKVSYSGTFTAKDPYKRIETLDAQSFREVMQAQYPEGTAQSADIQRILNVYPNQSTDWQDAIYQTGLSTDQNIGIAGKAGFMPFRISLGYNTEKGTLKTSKYERYTGAVNLSPKFFDNHLSVDINVKGTINKNRFADSGAVGAAAFFDPTKPIYDEENRYNGYWNWGIVQGAQADLATQNPLSLLYDRNNHGTTKRSLGNIQLDYKIHGLEDLHANLNLGYDVAKTTGRNFVNSNSVQSSLDKTFTGLGQGNTWNNLRRNHLLDFYMNYAKNIESIKSNFDIMAGYSWQHFYYANHDITYSNPTEDLGAKEGYTYDANERHYIRDDHRRIPYENYLISFFGRLNYNFMDRYLLTATLRRDGSSRFSENNRWGLFPSAALAWTISNEPFMKATENVLSKLKLRLGYGVTGQQEIGDYQYITSYSFSTNPNTTYLGTTLLKPNGYSPDLKWEQTTTYNVAIDFGFLNNRINGSIEYYQKHTKDLLNTISAAAGTNFINLITANVGKMKNKGVEANVNAIAIQSKDFTWEVGYNITWNDSKITKLTTTFNPDYQGIDAGTNQKHQVGEMPGTFYLYQQVYDENGKPIQNAFVDRNNDGQITEADRYLTHKSPMAKVYMGFSSQFSYKKWDLGFNLRANFGNYVYNGVASGNSTSNNYGGKGFVTNLYNGFQDTGFTLLNTSEQMASDYFLENASFLKMDNITLGYSFQNLFAAKLSGRISASVQNVFTISKYSGLDPECGAIDSNIWPRPRTYTIGLNLNF